MKFNGMMRRQWQWIAIALLTAMLAGCAGTTPSLGGASGQVATGAAGGESAQNASSQLCHCDETLGTIAVHEDQTQDWWHYFYSRYPQLGSTVPVLRMMIQQSNCFVVVDRGRAMGNMMQERQLQQSGEMRQGSNFGKGQMVAADYTMDPSIQFSQQGTSGFGGAIGGLLPSSLRSAGVLAGAAAGSLQTNEAATTLLLIDNRSGVQLAAAVGSAKNFDFGFFGGAVGRSFATGGGGYTNTPEGKVITAAFMDSYNQMVQALRNYKAQTIKGGLGTGGSLGVQGGTTDASKKTAP
jgi:curli biogenesis system outer membrane secretion channel CsgG